MNGIPNQSAVGLPAHVSRTGDLRILFVEDDKHYRDALGAELSEHGFAVHSFADGASLLGSLDSAAEADVIVVEWTLPKTSGIDLLRQLRRQGVTLPVVFLTGVALPERESLAFDRGAADFIDKQRGVAVLVRRLKCLVEVRKATTDLRAERSMICGKLCLRPEISRAYWNGADLDLTLGEYNIVHLLASNVGKCVTYRAIYDQLHYEGFIAGNGADGYRVNVRSAIKRIRDKFCECDPAFVGIKNHAAFGYCWQA
jgi:two-component system, OmpR family, response regulator ChvI